MWSILAGQPKVCLIHFRRLIPGGPCTPCDLGSLSRTVRVGKRHAGGTYSLTATIDDYRSLHICVELMGLGSITDSAPDK